MKIIELLHRWTGGFVGLFLAVMGLSGAFLVHKEDWMMLPHAGDEQRQDVDSMAAAIETFMSNPDQLPSLILFANADFGLHRVTYGDGSGVYTTQAAEVVSTWGDRWDRIEFWLFDLHHYLFAGDTGATLSGIFGLCGLGFVITGVILWWRTRKTFQFRLWPARLSRPAIVRQHRDYGIVVAPLLVVSMITGVMLNLQPVADILLSPWSPPGAITQGLAPPRIKGGPLSNDLDWKAMLTEVRQQYPDTEFRVLLIPAREGGLITLRTRQPEEWLPQGRTTFWFDPANGQVVASRDALAMSPASQVFNKVFPIHAAEVGGLPFRIVMSLSGLSLALLGSLSVWSFWFKRVRE